jgi:muramoyltetrapeptide carboxypeptidase
MLRAPRALPPNPHLAVLAISSPSELPRILDAKANLERRGVRITLAGNIAHSGPFTYLAGSDDERVETTNALLRDPQYDGFLFARGGYGAMRILERIDFEAISADPRPIIGFSDLTALHQAIALRCGVGTFHGPMVNLDFHDGLSASNEEWFWSMLAGDAPLVHRFEPSQTVMEGEAEGILFGGCLSLTASLSGTPFDYWPDDGIWFWEDIDEKPYRLDRMLTTLRLSGRLRRVRGVIVGRLRGCGSDVEIDALLRDFFGSSSIPVVRDLPFGHHGDNLLMPIGVSARLSTVDTTFTVTSAATRRR